MNASQAPSIHDTIVEAFSKLGITDLPHARVTAMMHNLFCIGRHYCFGAVNADWMIEEGSIQLHAEDGELLMAIALEPVATKRLAA